MKRVILFLIFASSLRAACTLAISSPTSAQSISIAWPTATFSLSVTPLSCPNLFAVDYQIDGDSVGFAYAQNNFTLPWNPFREANGTHSVVAVAHDALSTDAPIATSAAVSFTLANSQMYSNGAATFNAGVSVIPSCTTNCAGSITFTITVSGTFSAFSAFTTSVWVDGQPVITDGACGNIPCNASEVIDTRNYYDGPHVIRVEGAQGINGESHVYGWQQIITFLNGSSVPVALNASAREVFLQPAGAYTLSGTLYNADGSTVASPTLQFLTLDPTIATVNQNTGVITAVGAAPNAVQIGVMAEVTTGTNLHITSITSNTANVLASFVPSMKGDLILITSTGSGGCVPGLYTIASAGTGSGSVTPPPGTAGTTGCHFITGPSRFIWVYIHSSNAVPHLSRGGGILTSYNSAASFWHASIFFHAQTFNTYPNWCADYNGAGYNTLEFELEYTQPASITQSVWTANQAAYTAAQQSTAQNCHSYLHGIMDSWWRGDPEMFATTRGPAVVGGAAWTTPPLTVLMQNLANVNNCTPSLTNRCYGSYVYTSRYDEFSTTWGGMPLPGIVGFGHGNLSQIVCDGTTCIATWPGWQMSALRFIISGATNTALNSPCPSPGPYTAASLDLSHFSFLNTITAGTYNSSTDPNLTIEPFAHDCHGSDYVRYDAFQNVMNWMTAATGNRPIGTWTDPALTSYLATKNVGGNPAMADNTDQYVNESGSVRLFKPAAHPLFTQLTDFGDFTRLFYPSFQDGKPFLLPNAAGISAYYTFVGYPCTITSFAGDTITCDADHGLRNVFPGTTRVAFSGMSNSADNGNYYVRATPTNTTIQLYIRPPNGLGTGGAPTMQAGTGSMTFSNGVTKTFGAINNQQPPQFSANDTIQSCTVANNRGLQFSISGTGTNYDGKQFYYPINNSSDTPCVTGLQGNFFLVPAGSSTSGTATITPDNWAHRGLSNMGASPGPLYHYVSHTYPAILGAAGIRTYPVVGFDPQYYNWGTAATPSGVGPGAFSTDASTANSKFNNYSDFSQSAEQFGPYSGSIGSGVIDSWVQDWWAIGLANLQNSAKAKWLFKPHLPSPDIGVGFECTARGDTGGALVVCQSFWNNTQTMLIPTSAYLQSGQAFIQDYCTYLDCTVTRIAAGTTSVSVTCAPGCTVWLRFPANAAAEWSPPTISSRLADVTNAVKVVVQYAYTPFPMNSPAGQGLLNSFDCDVGTCSLPVDLKISQLYYRVLYLSSTGTLLATSDVQQIAQTQ